MRPRLHHLPVLTTALTALAVALWAIPGGAATLQYDRTALASGELWRAVTGHWTHWSPDHLTWDLIVFAVFGALLENRSRRAFAAVVAGSALAIPAALWLFTPELTQYRGLSGIDSALFAAFFARLLRDAWRERSLLQAVVPALALLGFVGKSAFELTTGATLFVSPTSIFTSVPVAHLVGAAVGLFIAIMGGKSVRPLGDGVPNALRPFLTITLVIFTINGCSSHVVPSVEERVRSTAGTLAGEASKHVDISEMLPYMRRAVWTDAFLFWKVSHRVILADGTRVRFEQFGAMFAIDGIDGTFLITDTDRKAYETLRNRILFGYL
jgi:rhomboid family GlyGly-CTERM serine protease